MYIAPDVKVYISNNVVACSQSGDLGDSGNNNQSGGIQLPFIPG